MKKFLVVAALLTAGCSPGLRVDAFPTQPESRIDCAALYADLPRNVAGQDRILVRDDIAVAWGAPPIILRCGVEKPAELTVTSACYPVKGVDWFAETTADGFIFTTIGRRFFVSVEVPGDYDPAADTLADLADSIEKHVPSIKPCV